MNRNSFTESCRFALALVWLPLGLFAGEPARQNARLPGVPSVPEIVQMMDSRDDHSKRLAAGFLRLLTAEDGPALEALWKPRAGDLNTEMVRRGFAPAIAFTVIHVFNGTNQNQDYFKRLMLDLNSDELKPLAKAVSDHIKQEGEPYLFTPIQLAGKSGERALVQWAMQEFDPPHKASFLKDLFVLGQSEGALAALRPFALSGPKPRRLAALAALPHGWRTGPDAAWNALLRDPEPAIRQAFVQSLNGSSSPAALASAEQALADKDPSVANGAAAALTSYQGADVSATLQKFALDKRLSPFSRANLWRSLAARRQPVLIKDAQDLFLDRTQDRSLRAAAAAHLNSQEAGAAGGGEWVLSNLSRVEPELQSLLLTEMSASQSKEVLAKVPALVARLDAKLGAPILRALGNRRDPDVLELMINALKDPRPEIQLAAQEALSAATGLALPRQSFSADPKAPKPNPQQAYAYWHTWYERFGKPPAPELQKQLDTLSPMLRRNRSEAPVVTAAALGFDPYDALLRLSMDHNNSYGALRMLARLDDPRVMPTLLDLSENELFSAHRTELTAALVQLPPTPDGVARMLKKLDSPDESVRAAALGLLIAWHADAAATRIADEVFSKDTGFYDEVPRLAEWKHPAVMGKARGLVAAPKTDPEVRSRAVRLLVAARQPQDVRLMLQLVQDPKAGGDGDRNVVSVLARMVLDGSVEATQGFAGFISGKDLALRHAALKGLADAILQSNGENPKSIELPEGITAALRGTLTATTKESLPDVLSVLVLSGDTQSLNALMPDNPGAAAAGGAFANPDAEQLSALVSAVTRLHSPNARRFVLALVHANKLSGPDFVTLYNWLKQWSGMSKTELDAIVEERDKLSKQNADAALGRGDDGLTLTVNLNTTQIPFDRRERTESSFPITVQNTGKTLLKINDEGTVRVHWRSAVSDNSTSCNAQIYLGKAKPPATKAAFHPLNILDIAPGKSVTGTLVMAPPAYVPGPIPHQVSFQWNWTASAPSDPRATVAKYPHGFYGTRWVELSLIPDLWLAVDERTQQRK